MTRVVPLVIGLALTSFQIALLGRGCGGRKGGGHRGPRGAGLWTLQGDGGLEVLYIGCGNVLKRTCGSRRR